MVAKAAYVYACFFFALATLLVGVSLFLHVRSLLGVTALGEQYGQRIVFAIFLTAFAAAGLAKDRNVWKNEFKSCPAWLRASLLTLAAYGWLCCFVEITSSAGDHTADKAVISTAMSLFLGAMPLCILYPAVFRGPEHRSELAGRIPASVGLAAVVVLGFLADRAGYLPHSHR